MPCLPAVSLRLPLILLAFAAALVFIPFIQASTSRLASAAVTVRAQSDATLSALTVSDGAKDLTLDPIFVPGTFTHVGTTGEPNLTVTMSTGHPRFTLQSDSATRTVAENTAAGVDIGEPVATTSLAGTVVYTLGGTDAASFDIVASTGQLQTKAALDYETRSGYEVTVTATDTDDSVTTTVAIQVTNVTELTSITGPSSVEFPENSWSRVATFTASSEEDRADIEWILGGADIGHFSIDKPPGALRFALDAVAPRIFSEPPDFEAPVDGDAANTYELNLFARAGSDLTDSFTVTVAVTDVDEEGALSLSSTRPSKDSAMTAELTDPEGVTAGTALWQWERSTGRNAWAVINGAAAASYTPLAADTNTFLRVTATYDDEHGTGKTVSEVAPNLVTGPLLTGLTAESDDSLADSARGLYPAFDPLTLHYGIGCTSTDTLVLTMSAAADARVAVDGVQAGGTPVSVAVTEDSDVAIRVTDASGAATTYVVHCLVEQLFKIETHTFANTDTFEDLLLLSNLRYLRLMDRNGVPRVRFHIDATGVFAIRFHRVGADGAYRYGFRNGSDYTILDEDFSFVADDVRTVSPLTTLNYHDFQILEDGNYLLMAWEPAMRDFSDIELPYPDGVDVSSVDVLDSAFQIVTPGRRAVFTWKSWGHMALEDCVLHNFPLTLSTAPVMRSPGGGYAHLNGMHLVNGVLVASMRGCSKALGIDVEPGPTQGDVLWRMGRTNLSDAEWAARDIGPRPLDFINDPEGEFCGQHTARFLPNGNVFLFDNGVSCAIDPWTFEQLGREGSDFSRAVEYALDLENHEAVFVRDHSLRGTRDHIGHANGNVDVLDNGDWLVSWGRNRKEGDRFPDNEMVTLVDPATGQEKLGIRFRELPADPRYRRITATVAPAEALAPQPVPLTAQFPASEHTSIFHTGAGDSPKVVVAFNQPVVDFIAASPSISVTGATVASVNAHVVAGEPANAYLVTLSPDGDAAISFRLLTGQTCADGGICTADGTMLSEVPAAIVIKPPPEVSFEQSSYSVGEGGTLTVGLRLSAAHQGVLEVVIPVILDTSESASEADITAEENVTFAPGETRKTLSIRAIDDDLVEGSESAVFRLGALPAGVTAGTTTEGTVTITDPDRATISFTAPTLQVAEGGHAPLTFAITNGVTFQRDQTITLTVGGTAAGEDFTIAGGDNQLLLAPYSLAFPAGASFVTATVRVADDTGTEPTNETVTVSALLDLTSTSLGARTVTIAPSDPTGAPVITGSPVAAGSPKVGETLVVDTSAIALGGGQRPALFSYDWVADGDRGRIVTARNIYRVRPDDAGFTISVGVGIQADDGSVQLVRSATTSTVAAAVPASPGIVSATVGAAGSLHLTWEAPTWDVSNFQQGGSGVGDGGSPITGYTVQWKESTASWETAAAVTEATVTTTSHAIAGLTAGTAYTVRVVATNNVGDSSPSLEVTVQDTVVNWGPVIAGDAWLEYAENGTGPVHTFLARDPESDTVTWSLAGDDSGAFSITGGVLRFARSPDYEDPDHSSTFRVTVQAADATNRTAHPVAIVVTDVDEPPEISGVTTISDYDENGTGDVATFTASDPEGETNITWTLAGTDSGDFTITGGVLRFASDPDYESPADSGGNNHYEVTVQATDSTNKRGELHVDVIVQNVDEPPELTGPDTVDDFPENSTTSQQVGRYTAIDPEGTTVTLSLTGADSDDFALASNGVLTFGESPDYEEQNRYIVTMRAVAGSHTVNKTVTVNIQNVEEPGAVSLSTVQPQEGTSLTATLEDDDVPTSTTWQWYRTSNRGSTGTAITGATSGNYIPEDPADVGYYLRAVAMYDDGHGTDKTAFAVSANRVQEAPPGQQPPVFPADGDYGRSVRENLPAGRNLGAPVTATDDDNDRLTYSIPASDYFEIVDSTGQLRTKAELDHEDLAVHTVRVTATDPSNRSDSVDVTITVEDLDETPEISGPNNPEVAENSGTNVATYTATDPDDTGIDWVLTGTDSDAFTLSGGTLTFNAVPDYEEKNSYRVTIEAREQGDGTSVDRLSVTVRVTNVDEPGTVEANVEEPRVGQALRLNLEDEDGGESVSEWKWEKGEPNSPCGTVGSPTVTNWETIPGARGSGYTPTAADQGNCIRVTAIYNDRAGTGRSEQFLTTESVEYGPYFDADTATDSVPENSDEGSSIGTYRARHSNSGETLTYTLGGADASYFTYDSAFNQLKRNNQGLDYETQPGPQAVVEITAADTQTPPQSATITVTISITDECQSAGEPPCAPGRPSVSSASDTSLRITWSTPRTPSGTTITGYDVQYRESDSGASWIPQGVAGTDRSHTIENLIKDTTYEVQVRAINNSNGQFGEWSQSGTGTPGYVPPPPPPPPPPPVTTTTTTTGGGGGGPIGGGGGFAPPAAPAPPRPATNFQRVEQVFQPLTRNSTLGRVWRLIEPSQRWLFYDPNPQFAPFNTLRSINLVSDPPAVVAINVNRNQQFRGAPLYAGWNFVPVTAEPLAAQPGSGTQPVSQLFRPLADSDVLQRVWWLDSRTQEWKFYNPDPAFAQFNTLTSVDLTANPPVVLAISVSSRQEFRGRTLYRGWNYVVMR